MSDTNQHTQDPAYAPTDPLIFEFEESGEWLDIEPVDLNNEPGLSFSTGHKGLLGPGAPALNVEQVGELIEVLQRWKSEQPKLVQAEITPL